jgi:hypothetical protein
MSASQDLGVLHARIDEVEPGLFKAAYIEETMPRGSDAMLIPDTHIATSRDGVRMWVERMAADLGYQRVDWQ